MSDKVVSLNGDPINAGVPDPRVVKHLSDYLEMAQAGEITGIAIAGVYRDGACSSGWTGIGTFGMVGNLYSLMQRITFSIDR